MLLGSLEESIGLEINRNEKKLKNRKTNLLLGAFEESIGPVPMIQREPHPLLLARVDRSIHGRDIGRVARHHHIAVVVIIVHTHVEYFVPEEGPLTLLLHGRRGSVRRERLQEPLLL